MTLAAHRHEQEPKEALAPARFSLDQLVAEREPSADSLEAERFYSAMAEVFEANMRVVVGEWRR